MKHDVCSCLRSISLGRLSYIYQIQSHGRKTQLSVDKICASCDLIKQKVFLASFFVHITRRIRKKSRHINLFVHSGTIPLYVCDILVRGSENETRNFSESKFILNRNEGKVVDKVFPASPPSHCNVLFLFQGSVKAKCFFRLRLSSANGFNVSLAIDERVLRAWLKITR